MINDEIVIFCKSLPYVTEDIKWGSTLCYSVAGKLFFVVSIDESPVAASFKVADEDFYEISEKPGFIQAPYFAKNKWVKILDLYSISDIELKKYILNSYNLIKFKLTKKMQKEIDEMMS